MNLAYVVQQRGRLNLLDISSRKTELDSYGSREFTYTNGVARCIRVSCFNGFNHDL